VLAPPVIHEQFTLLPCPMQPTSTLDQEGCVEHALLRSDRAIDARVKAIFGLLSLQPARRDFVRGEQAWLVYRRNTCAEQASKYAGGTLASLTDAICQSNRNDVHLKELRSLEGELRRR
jgi:uncharacterized protein YecT (DUF1311 family)